jgi:hypothetical protein
MLAAGKTAGMENIKPRGLSIIRGGRGSRGALWQLLGAIFTYAVHQGHLSTIGAWCRQVCHWPTGTTADR